MLQNMIELFSANLQKHVENDIKTLIDDKEGFMKYIMEYPSIKLLNNKYNNEEFVKQLLEESGVKSEETT